MSLATCRHGTSLANTCDSCDRDELTRLRTLLDTLMKAVEPFASTYERFREETMSGPFEISRPEICDMNLIADDIALSWGDLRRAREAYLKAKGE